METKFFIESFGGNCFSLISIKNSPFLVVSFMLVPDDNFSSFFVFATMDIKAFLGLLEVAEVFSFIGEHLPPSGVGAPDLEFA
jgi:hypothetical protein